MTTCAVTTTCTGTRVYPSTLSGWWADAFARRVRAWSRDARYTLFAPPLEQDGRRRFAGNRFLQVPELGGLVVDRIHDLGVPGGLSIGGIAYLDRVMGDPTEVARVGRALRSMSAVQVDREARP